MLGTASGGRGSGETGDSAARRAEINFCALARAQELCQIAHAPGHPTPRWLVPSAHAPPEFDIFLNFFSVTAVAPPRPLRASLSGFAHGEPGDRMWSAAP